MSTTQLALPAADRSRPRAVLTLGSLLAGAASLMAFAGLAAAYINVRHLAGGWPPEGVEVDNYLGTILVITALMSSAMVEWGAVAARRGLRRQAMAALALSILMASAHANAVWYLGTRLGFPVTEHAYGALAYAMVGLSLINALAGLVLIAAAWGKVAGRQSSGPFDEVVRSAAWYWQFVVAGWVIVYATLFLLK
jgi:heme/copper-type cytochrome/quinol oxidase subunit 3